jgi:hypothetical protein
MPSDAGEVSDAGDPLDEDGGGAQDAGTAPDSGSPPEIDGGDSPEPDGGNALPPDSGPLPPDSGVAPDLTLLPGDFLCDADRNCVFDAQLASGSPTPGIALIITRAPDYGSAQVESGLTFSFRSEIDFGGRDTLEVAASDGQNTGPAVTMAVQVINKKSCFSILATGGSTGDGSYRLDADGAGPEPEHRAYCDMTGGGWTLALKVDGDQSTFYYDNGIWTDATLLNDTSQNLDDVEAKFDAFNLLPAEEVRVGFRRKDALAVAESQLVLKGQNQTLREIFAGSHLPALTRRDQWLASVAGSSLQPNCNLEGFNVTYANPETDTHRARIGIIGNNEADCWTPESRIGVGTRGAACGAPDGITAGSVSRCGGTNGDGEYPAFARVYVRAPDFGKSPVRASCQAHLDAGATHSAWYRVDPDGPGNLDPFEVYCNMEMDGGGWAVLASYSGGDGESPLTSGEVRRHGSPGVFAHTNLRLEEKVALSSLATESLFLRQNDIHLIADAPIFSSDLLTPGSDDEIPVNLRIGDAVISNGTLAWSRHDISAGGDFGLALNPTQFDHHSILYYNLNGGCAGLLIYSYSAGYFDSDVGYDANTALDSWTATSGCNGAEGGTMPLVFAVR